MVARAGGGISQGAGRGQEVGLGFKASGLPHPTFYNKSPPLKGPMTFKTSATN